MIVQHKASQRLRAVAQGQRGTAYFKPIVLSRQGPVAHARPKPRSPNGNGGDEQGSVSEPDDDETEPMKADSTDSTTPPPFFQTPAAPKFNFKRVEDSSEWKASSDDRQDDENKVKPLQPGDRFKARFKQSDEGDSQPVIPEVVDALSSESQDPSTIPPFFSTPPPPKFVFKRVEGDATEASDSEAMPQGSEQSKEMSLADAALLLGTEKTASFDDILKQKNQMLKTASPEQAEAIERAYDVLFSASLKRRLSGQSDVIVSGIRSKDPTPAKKQNWPSNRDGSSRGGGLAMLDRPGSNPLKGMPSMGGGMPVSFSPPRSQSLALQQSAIFAALILWAALQASFEPPQAQMSDTAGLQLSIALTYTVYSLRENKGMDLGKAVGIGIASLFLGAIIGNGIQTWLRVDLIPIGSFQSPGVFCSCFALLTLLISTLLIV